MEISVLVRSLKSSILSSTSFQISVVSAAVEQSRHKANMVAQGEGNSAREADPRIHSNKKKPI